MASAGPPSTACDAEITKGVDGGPSPTMTRSPGPSPTLAKSPGRSLALAKSPRPSRFDEKPRAFAHPDEMHSLCRQWRMRSCSPVVQVHVQPQRLQFLYQDVE